MFKQASPRFIAYTLQQHQATKPSRPPTMAAALPRWLPLLLQLGVALGILLAAAEAWTGEIRGRVVCDVCGDAAIGPEDHALEGQSTSYTSLLSPVQIYRALSAPCGSPAGFRATARADLGLAASGVEIARLIVTNRLAICLVAETTMSERIF